MDALIRRLHQLSDAVTKGAYAIEREFYMSIPPRRELDADIVLATAAKEIERLRAENKRFTSALEHILEYWNRDQNHEAMVDALWHIIETAEQALSQGGEGV